MSLLRSIYLSIKKLPLIGSGIERVRLAAYHFVQRVLDEKLDHIEQQVQQVQLQYQQLSERVEFVRLELFYEIMNQRSTGISTQEQTATDPIILNETAYQQAIATQSVHLNIGCGHKPMVGYLNVDQRALPQVDIQASALDLPFESGQVDSIYAAHLIEHFTLQMLRTQLLPYWHACLKPNGILRLIAPNTQAMVTQYAQQQISFEQLTTVLLGMQEYDGDFHFAMLAPDNLRKLLQEVGFTDIELVTEARENGLCWEMEMTARKPLPT